MSDHRQGPVRSEAARLAVLDATSRLFAVKGYDHFTMEGVAAEAGVSKQTIYRWWSSKGALIAESLLEGRLFPDQFIPTDTGDIRRDLGSWLHQVFTLAEEPQGEFLVRSLIAAAAENAEVGRRLNEQLGATDSLTERLQKAVDAGQLRADAPLAEVGEALVGAVIMRALSRTPTDPEAIDRLISVVLGFSAASAPTV